MFYRRKASDKFSPIVNKENKNSINFDQIAPEDHQPKKQFVLTLKSHKKVVPINLEANVGTKEETEQKDSSKSFKFVTLKKPIESHDQPSTECPCLNKKEPSSQKSLSISSKLLKFYDEPTEFGEYDDSEWKVETVEVLPPCKDLFYDVENSDDEEVEEWHERFQEYDMDSDKENMSVSDSDYEEVDSDVEEENKDSEAKEEAQIVSERKTPFISRYSFDSILKQRLNEIHEEDETTNTIVFEIKK